MNTEDFVTYEQALALKKLGFVEKCLYYYNANAQIVANERDYQEEVSVKDLYTSYNGEYTSYNRVDAPTLAQAQKWLRKEKDIIVLATCDLDYKNGHSWYWLIDVNFEVEDPNRSHNSYEEALSAGIDKCLKLLENEKTKTSNCRGI